jgi:hypothetical protein
MEWAEINCIIAGLEALIEKYQDALRNEALPEDEHSGVSSDLAYAEILHGKYEELRKEAASN